MADVDWTVEGLEHLTQTVQAVLARYVTVADLPELYALLASQAAVWCLVYDHQYGYF